MARSAREGRGPVQPSCGEIVACSCTDEWLCPWHRANRARIAALYRAPDARCLSASVIGGATGGVDEQPGVQPRIAGKDERDGGSRSPSCAAASGRVD